MKPEMKVKPLKITYTLVHLNPDGHEDMRGGAPPAPLNYIWQDLLEINRRIV